MVQCRPQRVLEGAPFHLALFEGSEGCAQGENELNTRTSRSLTNFDAGMAQNENRVDFYNLVFPGEAKMCLGFMSFRAPSAALKQKNYHNSPNMQPIITEFQVLFKSVKCQLLTIVPKLSKRVLCLL